MTNSIHRGTVLCVAALLGITACNQSPQPPRTAVKQPSAASVAWKQTADSFIDDYLRSFPSFAAQEGKHEYDGQLPDLSAHGLKRLIGFLHEAQKTITAVDGKTLEPREQFDRDYLLAVIGKDLFWLEKTNFPHTNPAFYLDRIDPDMYINRDYAPIETRLKAFIKYLKAIPRMSKDIQDNLKSPLPKTYLELGVEIFNGMAEFYSKNAIDAFASVSDPELQKQLKGASTDAANAMGNLRNYLINERKNANDKFALGADLFAQMVQSTELVDVPVEQIEAAGKADLARNTAALKSACDSFAPKASLAQCMAKMLANKPKNGPVEEARAMLPTLKDFIVKNNVVAIPSADDAKVAEAPPYNRANSAFIQVPGPYEKGVASVYNIAPPDPKWSKAEQAAYIPGEAVLLTTTVHEVWPGHFLQFLHSNANPNKLEGLWVGYAFAEGWAHYAEEMMIEMGLAKDDPEKHIGQLSDALLRNVRLLSAIGLHTHGMTVAQSEKMFREQAFQDPGNARQQAARGTYDPAYLNYTLGKLMILKMRSDWMTKNGIAADDHSRWHEFHDQFLSFGGPPIPLVRRQMLGENNGGLL